MYNQVNNEEIKIIFHENQLKDLKKFMVKREKLNYWNSNLIYLFYIIQSGGILTTSIAASINNQYLLWSGISLNMLAGLIQVFEKINDSQLKKLMKDILAIKEGTYIDEGPLIDPESDFKLNSNEQKQKYNTYYEQKQKDNTFNENINLFDKNEKLPYSQNYNMDEENKN